ncbi:MAG: ABC transporter permease [Sarcina sp.]
MRYLKLFLEQFKLSFMSIAIYKVNFILMLGQSILNTILNLLAVEFLYSNVNKIAGWNKQEMIILICTSLIVNQVFRAFVLPNQYNFIEKINDGRFDNILLKPMNLLFQINIGKFDFVSFFSAIFPIILVTLTLNQIGQEVEFKKILLYLVLIICGVIILSSFMLILNSLAFKFIKVDGLMNIYYMIMDISNKPKDIFNNKLVGNMFMFVIPALPLAYVPAGILLDKISLNYIWVSLVLSFILLKLSEKAIKTGIKHYSSASA